VGISFLVGGGDLQQETLAGASPLASYLLGYLVWYYATEIIADMTWNLRDELQTGTVEQLFMSPSPAGLLMVGQVLSTLLASAVRIILIGGGLVLLLNIDLPLPPAVIPVFLLIFMGLFGVGFVMGGATLIYKHIESLGDLLQYMLIFLNGVWLPVDAFPGWLATIARFLPTTQGILVLQRVVLEGKSLADVWLDGSLIWLAIHSTLSFALGWLIFSWCQNIARRRGSLGQY
jgi:ABC-2 type transport system permease protein